VVVVSRRGQDGEEVMSCGVVDDDEGGSNVGTSASPPFVLDMLKVE